MADTETPPPALTAEEEEAIFYHESALNANWTGARLALGSLTFLFGGFAFAYFYLRSLNSDNRWHGEGYHPPSMVMGTVIMLLLLVSAGLNYGALQQIKAGHKAVWQWGGLISLLCGLAAVGMLVTQLNTLPFAPGSSGYSSVFTGFYALFTAIVFCVLIWLQTLLARARGIPAISFVEQPPTHAGVFAVQRFQASLSAFTTVWTYMALMSFLFWLLFYAF